MTEPSLRICASLAVLLSAIVLAQNPVSIQFQPDPVQVQTSTDIVLTVVTVPQVLYMTWLYQGVTLGLWTGGTAQINPVPQFLGRVTITATQLRIGNAQLQDAGNYTVQVTPSATTGLDPNSRAVQVRVYEPVSGVSMLVPSVATEGRNLSLSCKWNTGTQVTVQWGKDGAAVIASSRITISGGSLLINPANRNDSGMYTCTVSNPVSAQTATQSITVYYGPDTPVVTKVSPKACVGGGDLLVGQTVGFTCESKSLPPALYSWQWNGNPVSSQSGSGSLTLQTYSTNQSGQYVCTASNSITGYTSAQGTSLSVVAICLSVGEVAGIVVGCLLLLIILVLLIVLIVYVARRNRAPGRERDAVVVQKTNPQTTLPDPQPNGARELGQGPQPPLYPTHTRARNPHRLYTAPPESHGNPQTPNGLHNPDTHSGRTDTNHNAVHNNTSYPHNGIDNPAFVHTEEHNANPLPNTQQNPNILIQTGPAQGGTQPQAVHVSLNTLPQTAQQNSSAQMPTIHVNLNSYPANALQTQQDRSSPLTNIASNPASQTQQNQINTEQSHPRGQSGLSYPSDPQLIAYTGNQGRPGLIPTGYTHNNRHNTSQRNANTQTYQEETENRSRSSRTSGRHDATPSSTDQQMSWDLLRGTPSYPIGMPQREQLSAESSSDYTENTIHPPIREPITPNRSQPRLKGQQNSWNRAPTRQDAPSVDRQARSHSADLRNPNTRSVTQLEAARPTQRRPRTQRESAQQDMRGPLGSQTAPRQEATHSSNPQALPLMSQQASVGRSAVSQGTTAQQGPTAPRGTDTRALADPNHLPQADMAQQHRAASIQTQPQVLGTQTQPVIHNASQPRQGGTAPIPYPSAQSNPSNLTQAALKAHTENTQTFHSRKQQTQAALLHAGSKVQHPPTPPPVIPITEFQTLPKEPTQHRARTRGPQPLRTPANIPIAQRPIQQWPNVQSHPAVMPVTHHPHHHQHPRKGHVHVSPNRHPHAHDRAHVPGHRDPAHFRDPQQQTHRGRPR
ncbi:uncharacterized protein si:dkeyp-97a10.3 isoform X2 [Channa argus]|uniref:uncharacterized protein si:dkeyp-97a10.3 isoform X2 n=1 Tax=Channa argus TaxID=215402 RepID=UPI0035208C63